LNDVWAHADACGGVELLASALAGCDRLVDRSARERAVRCLRTAAVGEMIRHRALCELADACARDGVRALLIKGAGLAYTVYPIAHLRPSCDTDVLIREEDLERAERMLDRIGYGRVREPDVQAAGMQRHYVRRGDHGFDHFIDLHWRIVNRHVFASALTFDDAWRRSQGVERLCAAARTLATSDALLLACIHRVAHHDDEDDLVWLWDIHLLAHAMTPAENDALAARAAASGMRAVVGRGLDLAHARFGTAIDPRLLSALRAPGPEEPAARLIGGGSRQVDLVLSDLAALPSFRTRARLVYEHLFPNRAYIRAKYERWPVVLLPLAYVDRIARGASKWLRRTKG
jgi:hypothetical protein